MEIIPARDQQIEFEYTASGDAIDGSLSDNLCARAYQLIKKDLPDLAAIKLHLHKAIPSGAGLGGGSADAAFTLQLLDRLFRLKISPQKMSEYALQLGSDCTFFLLNKPAFATGRGEQLEPIQIDLQNFKILVVNPRIHVNTGQAFSQLNIVDRNHTDLRLAIQQPIEKWKDSIHNDFELPVFAAHPELANIKKNLYEFGAVYASMSGSGSSIFGIFPKERQPEINFPAHYFCKFV